MRVAALRVKNNEEWEKLIPIAQYVINTTVNRMTGRSPYEALFGDFRKPARGTLEDWDKEKEIDDTIMEKVTPGNEMNEYVKLLNDRIREIQEIMRINQKESTDRRNGKIAEKINEYNDKMDEQMTK
ncbi:hypothetical protein ADUPG1_002762, partial [Aduncisulcus paluster]